MIAQRNLSLLANRLARLGGRRTPETVLERDYCLAWFLCEFARSPLAAALAFKGGTALKRCYFGDYRFSEDLDFTMTAAVTIDAIRAGLNPVFTAIREASGIVFRFDREDRQAHGNSLTFYLGYVGPLPAGGGVKVDVTLRERVCFPLVRRPVLRGYEEFADVPRGRMIGVYSLDEIAAEKIVALSDRARNEPRDLYDLWYLAAGEQVEWPRVSGAVETKLQFRGRATAGVADAIAGKEARLKALWTTRLGAQMAEIPEFDVVFREVRRAVRRGGL